MKILQLCNKVPYPAKDGGAIAMLSLSRTFADLGHEITILAMNTLKHHTSSEDIPSELKKRIEFHLVPVDTRIRIAALIRNLIFSRRPYNAERFIDTQFERKLVELLKNKPYDIIQLEGLYLLPYIPVIRNSSSACIALRAHNVESEIWSRIKKGTANPVKRLYFGVIARRLRKFELKGLNTYDLLVPITARDATAFQNLGNSKPVKVIPTGIPEQDFLSRASSSATGRRLFFIGSLDWIPNQEGITWFTEKVWPRLMDSVTGIEFHMAGRNAPAWLEKDCTEKGLTCHGEVDDAKRFMDLNDIMVVPLFAGSGMRIKIIEAMARSKAVVTTAVGAEGLGVENGKHIIIGNTADEFVTGIMQLIKDNEFLGKIQENAFVYTQQNFNNQQLTGELIEFYKNHPVC